MVFVDRLSTLPLAVCRPTSRKWVDVSTKPVPDEWAKPMRKLGYVHRGQPSISRLAREADLSVETVRRFVHRIGKADAETVAALSKAMRQDVSSWVGSREAGEPFVGPDSSRWLDDRQRHALTELINSFVKGAPWLVAERPEDDPPGRVATGAMPFVPVDPPKRPAPSQRRTPASRD